VAEALIIESVPTPLEIDMQEKKVKHEEIVKDVQNLNERDGGFSK
jgi:hypothetical protein